MDEPEQQQAAAVSGSSASGASCCRRPPACPPWLQAAIADIEQRVRALAVDEAPPTEHSFADRAENYYQKRPRLLALLADLHQRYLCLADRYAHSLAAAAAASSSSSLHHRNTNTTTINCCSSDDDDTCCSSSDADSSLSFQLQQQQPQHQGSSSAADDVVAELVVAWVRRDVLADEADRRAAESARRVELQGSLVDVLESERLVLLGENARLGLRASAAEAEAAAAAAELGYARRRAAEMARLVVKLREDHRVCALGRRIEALQAHVYGLELRNRECYEAMAAWEAERKACAAEVQRLQAENRRLHHEAAAEKRRRNGGGWWWARVRMAAEWTPCAPAAAATVASARKAGEQMKKKKGSKDVGSYYNYGGCFGGV